MMKWYWQVGGGHTHVRVFVNGAKCGDLCFRNDEFVEVKEKLENLPAVIEFHEDLVIKSMSGEPQTKSTWQCDLDRLMFL